MRPSRHFYIAELDGVRFFAFLAVFLLHSVYTTPASRAGGVRWDSLQWWTSSAIIAGGFGVDLFFVLSGFLITALLLREADGRGRIDVAAFWMRRILRIWPLYFSFVLLSWVVEGLPVRIVAAFMLFAGNWALLAWPAAGYSIIAPLWSVAVEEQFYLAWPLLLTVLPRRSLRPLCFGMIGVSLVARGLILAGGGGIERVFINTLARLDPIAVGALIALTWGDGRVELGRGVRRALAVGAPLLVVASTGLLWYELLPPSPETGMPLVIHSGALRVAATVLSFLVVAVCCGGVVVAALASRGSWLGHPVLVYLGRISYGLYVFHLVSVQMVKPLPLPWRCLVGFGVTVLLASLSYRFLEQPFLRLKGNFSYIRSAPPDEAAIEAAPSPVVPPAALTK